MSINFTLQSYSLNKKNDHTNIIYSLFLAFRSASMIHPNLSVSRSDTKDIRIFLLYFALFSLLALWLGWPRPNRDDLIFIGTPIRYFLNGGFENPYCSYFLEQLGTIRHLYYVPGHAILLALWLKIWGLSAVAFTAFTYLFWWIGGLSFYLILVRHVQLHRGLALLCVTHYLLVMAGLGLRPDSAGLGCMLAGIYGILQLRRRWQAIGYFLTVASVLIAPICFTVIIPVYVFVCVNEVRKLRLLLPVCIISSILLVAVAGFFIDFDYTAFYEVFTRHIAVARFRGYGRIDYLVHFFSSNMYAVLRLPFYLLGLSVLVYGCCRRIPFLMLLLTVALVAYWMYPPYALENLHLIIAFTALVYATKLLGRWWAGNKGLLAGSMLLVGMNIVFIVTNIFQVNEVVVPQDAAAITSEYVCGDAFAARYVYDYRLPGNFKSLDFYRTDFAPWSFEEQRENEVWIFGAIYPYRMQDTKNYAVPALRVGGKSFNSIVKFPNHLYIRRP